MKNWRILGIIACLTIFPEAGKTQIPSDPVTYPITAVTREVKGVDLLTPRLSSSDISFWYKNQCYHGGCVSDVSLDGNQVTIATTVGTFAAPWSALPMDARAKLYQSYQQILQNKTVQQAHDSGVFSLCNTTILSITDEGILIDARDKRYLLVDVPNKSGLADGDEFAVLQVKQLPANYSYTTASGAAATVHRLEYVSGTAR